MFDNIDVRTLIEEGKKLGLKADDIDITYKQVLEMIKINRNPVEIAFMALCIGRLLGYEQALKEFKKG